MTRSSRLLALVLAVVSSACSFGSSSSTTTTIDTPPSSDVTPTTSPSTSTTSALPPGIEGLPADLQAQVLGLIADTERLRGLDFIRPPAIAVVSPDELERRVREQFEEDIENVDEDQALYELLGLLDPGVDLLALYTDLYGEQVAGYYDGETEELVVPISEDLLSPLQQSTLVHELVHALTDQHFGMWSAYETLIDEEDFDAATALLGVIEGDAVLTEVLFIRGLTSEEQQSLFQDSFAADSDLLESAPRFIRDSLIFPYDQGFSFVSQVYAGGGHQAVDALYEEPPITTEQIIELDPLEEPIEVPAPLGTPDGYELVYDSVWGELGFQLMFDQELGGDEAAVEGWGGDSFLMWWDGENVVVSIDFRGDTVRDAEELGKALDEYVSAAMGLSVSDAGGDFVVYGGDRWATVVQSGDRVVFVAADVPSAGRRVSALLTGG